MWFKVDDNLAYHPKIIAAGNAAAGLWVRAGAWSSHYATGGRVPSEIASGLGGTRLASTLVKAGLWLPDIDGYQFHDWSAYNPTEDDAQAIKENRSRAGAEANHVRWHVKQGVIKDGCPFCEDLR